MIVVWGSSFWVLFLEEFVYGVMVSRLVLYGEDVDFGVVEG